MNTRINLWASPRNVSTAFMYSFAQREDCQVIDEPFYAAYLKESGELHPGREDILNSQYKNYQEVLEQVILKEYPREVVFFKQMSHHMRGQSLDFLAQCKNLILIRDPKEMILSFSKVIQNPRLSDLGLEDSHRIFQYLKKNNQAVYVINSRDLLENPERFMIKLCSILGIGYDSKMLSWKSGPIPEDGVWAPYWYTSVHKSTGFKPYHSKEVELPDKYQKLYKECEALYLDLQEESIQI